MTMFLRQLFCRHDYQRKKFYGWAEIFKCPKCEKTIVKWNYRNRTEKQERRVHLDLECVRAGKAVTKGTDKGGADAT